MRSVLAKLYPRSAKAIERLLRRSEHPECRKTCGKALRKPKTADPFDPRLGAHRINSLSAIFKRTVHAVAIEGDTVVTVNIGSHDIHKR